ncbi:MAG TPA: molybdenum cofactor biosynthesis protein MoaE [Myxococcota bacterium]|nr:molybdenum cofactor biosynthesis protein MoaE [Myxococcota bacterium]
MALFFAQNCEEFCRLNRDIRTPETGGFVNFVGRVRQFNHNKEVALLFYEAHTTLSKKMFDSLEKTARERFSMVQCHAVHRLARVEVSEDAVSIATLAAHRREAFLAAEYLIDQLKRTLPIWKKEVYADGSYAWGQHCCDAV